MSDGRRPRRQLVAKISRSYKGICRRRRRRRRVKGGIRSRRQNFTINHDEKALIHSPLLHSDGDGDDEWDRPPKNHERPIN